MSHNFILQLDIGTSSVKASIWNDDGHSLADITLENKIIRSSQSIAEINANELWFTVLDSIRQLISISKVDPNNIAGIGIDAIGWAVVPVNDRVEPLYPMMIWLDRRAKAEAEWLQKAHFADQVTKISANQIDSAFATPKILWLKNHQPKIFDQTYKFLSATGYIVAKLTGEFTCDFSQGYSYHFYDLRERSWNAEVANLMGIPLEKMPTLVPSNVIVGSVTQHVSRRSGLSQRTKVIAGCVDASVGTLGSGAITVGQTNEQGGQAGGFAVIMDRVISEPRLISSGHIFPDQYLLAAGTVGGGSLVWFRDQLGQIESDMARSMNKTPFELFSEQVNNSPVGANGLIYLPYMAGERTPLWSTTARGVLFGLTYKHTRADILRALMEGCAFAVYDNLDIAAEHGVNVTEFLGSGGATKSTQWCQIKADVYGKPFIVAKKADGTNGGHDLGLFILTSQALGLINDPETALQDLLPNEEIYEPSDRSHAIYEEMFGVYRSISRKLMPEFKEIDQIRRKFS